MCLFKVRLLLSSKMTSRTNKIMALLKHHKTDESTNVNNSVSHLNSKNVNTVFDVNNKHVNIVFDVDSVIPVRPTETCNSSEMCLSPAVTHKINQICDKNEVNLPIDNKDNHKNITSPKKSTDCQLAVTVNSDNIETSDVNNESVWSCDSNVIIEILNNEDCLPNQLETNDITDQVIPVDNLFLQSNEFDEMSDGVINKDIIVEVVNDAGLPLNQITLNELLDIEIQNDHKEELLNDPDYNPSIDADDVNITDSITNEVTSSSVEETIMQINSPEEAQIGKKKGRKKRQNVDKNAWTINKNKKAREIGENYCGKKFVDGEWDYKIPKEGRKMMERCSCKYKDSSKIKCVTVDEEERNYIFEKFWKMSWGEKKVYIDLLVIVQPTSRARDRKDEQKSRRESSYIYFMEKNQTKVRVCKKMFLNTLGIGEKAMRNWKKCNINKERFDEANKDTLPNVIDTNPSKETNTSLYGIKYQKVSEARRKHNEDSNKCLENFLDSLPKMESHYCRASTSKLYLEPDWRSKQDLYKEYCRWSAEKNIKPLSVSAFSNTFINKNLSLFRPKKDECDICVSYRTGNISEEVYNLHQGKKKEARAEKELDKDTEQYVFTMDLQSVLLCPKSQVSSLYYRTKLAVHNLTFFNLKTKDVSCYVWHEAEGGLTANEFTSIICDVINKLCPFPPDSKIILFSDGCCYQNRNAVLSNALFNLSKLKNITIIQKFLEKGHTQMEADSVHSQIERQVRGRNFNVPADYVAAIKNARSKPVPYNVHYLDHSFFRKYDTLNYFKSIRPGKKAGDPCVTDIRALQYTPKEVFFKLRFTDEWNTLLLRIPSSIQPSELTDIPFLYKERLPIKKSKYDDLQHLKSTLPLDYHTFYDNLPYH